ncbi:MAG TPA: NADH-quinone oxidoreductase subunit M [Aeromicrobium sp.]|nr:NADH-quinone oxidoreductase subunit M [Aeromicrobium sp.]
MILTLLMLTPLVGALVLGVVPRSAERAAKVVAAAFSLLALAGALAMLTHYDLHKAGFQLTEKHLWIKSFGVYYALGVDGIGVTLILLTTILTPIVILAAWDDVLPAGQRFHGYLAWMLGLEGLAIGVFSATDAALFYALFEATLIPIFFLIGMYGAGSRTYAAVKFLIYNLVGGLLMLASIIGLYFLSGQDGSASFLLADLVHLDIAPGVEKLLFLGFMAAFAIKAPLFPFHTWLPDAAASATPSTAVLMVSVIDKIGTFGMLRWGLGLFPGSAHWATPVVVALAVVSIIYGALLAIGQDDLRRLIAFTSVSHFGFIILGLFAATSTSTAGATFYMFNHGLSTAALFLVAGIMIARRGSASIGDFGGVQKVAPVLSGVFLVAGLSSLSLPGLAPFVSEFMVMVGTYTRYPVAAVVSVLGIVLAAIYILVMYQRTMTGPLRAESAGIRDLKPLEMASLAPAIVLIVGLGFFPQPLLNVINPAVDATLARIGAGDPPPKSPHFPEANGGHG